MSVGDVFHLKAGGGGLWEVEWRDHCRTGVSGEQRCSESSGALEFSRPR